MSIPAILGANVLALKDVLESNITAADIPVYLIGMAVSAVVGYLCIRLLKMIAEKGKFGFFAYYCWAAGALTLILTILK
jgi:undecaprenyl-diphosphatase